uniref:C-type lectin domain-containing protein n=1 Tax=Setaria digitata TaxID=48799 RepID=A0A915PZ47_9BILA
MYCKHVALCSTCEPGWRFSPHSRKCTKFFTKAVTWTEAEFHCRILGGYHLSIHGVKENKFAKEIAHDAPEIWLGIAEFGKSLKKQWSDKSAFDFKGWKNGQKPESQPGKPCTKMNTTNGEWFQSCCRKVAPYICQKDSQSRQPYHVEKMKNDIVTHKSKRDVPFEQRWRFLLRK